MRKRISTPTWIVAIAFLLSSPATLAQKCNSDGILTFIGATFDLTRSVWLSTTTAGSFGLQVVNTKDIVDEWSLSAPGQHISVSPNLVLSNGGTHELLDLSGNNPCSIDIDNQKSDPIILPQFPTIRPVPPIGVIPPGEIIDIMPELPVIRPPVDVITPEVPTVRPPGVGITPEIPTLRPPGTGITPEIRPPGTGITPEVRPPGTGITPEVRPPGTGITPEVRPPGTGITPEVRPPGTGITPEIPAQRPPETITPERPVTETQEENRETFADKDLYQRAQDGAVLRWVVCIHPETGHRMTAEYSGSDVTCPEDYDGHWYEAQEFDKSGLPLSARHMGVLLPRFSPQQVKWHLWSEVDQTEVRDRRGNRNFDSSESRLILGAHRPVGARGVAGLSVAASRFDSEGLWGFLRTDADRISIGPYMGYQFGPGLSLTSSLNYSRTDTDIYLANFRGSNDVNEWLFNIGLEGFQRWGNWGFLPRMHLNYSWFETSNSKLSGELLGRPLALNFRDTDGNISYLESSVTIMRGFRLHDHGMLTPYLELGVTMAIDLQNEVQVARGITSGGYQSLESLSGLARVGARWVMSERNYLDLEVSQESIDAGGLEIWQARLYFLHAF